MTYPTTYEEAVAYESSAAQLMAENMAGSKLSRNKKGRELLECIEALIPCGRYRHFKSYLEVGREHEYYEVKGVVEDVNSGLCYVKYVGNYGAYAGKEALRVVAGPDSFLRPIDRPEYKGVRFVFQPDTFDTLELV